MNGIIALMLSGLLFAHDSHNWLTDKKAYEFTQNTQARQVDISNFQTLKSPVSIDMSFFSKKLREFTGLDPIFINGEKQFISERGSKGYRNLAIHFLEAEFTKLGYKTSQKNYTGGGWYPRKGINLVSEKIINKDYKTLVLISHYDSVGNAGANDNGTGTIGMLTIAKALKDVELKYNLRFIQFDQEELGLIGSTAYVKQLSSEHKANILAVINVDMIGTNTQKDNKFHVMDCNREDSIPFANNLLQVIKAYDIQLEHVPGCTTRSDHAAFWQEEIPAILVSENFFGGDSDPCYHRRCDVFDNRIRLDYVQSILMALATTTKHLVTK